MSTRNILSFLEILESLYQFAVDFDVRPGLKFLLQKVAGLEVAANQYRLAGASMILYLHTLTHLCSRLGGLDMDSVHELLLRAKREEGEEDAKRRGEDSAAGRVGAGPGAEPGGVVGRSEGGPADSSAGSGDASESAEDAETPLLPAVAAAAAAAAAAAGDDDADDAEKEENNSVKDSRPSGAPRPGTQPAANSAHSSHPAEPASQPPANPSARPPPPPPWKRRGLASVARAWDSADVFLPMLREKCDAICKQYVDILAESQTESLVDRMCGRPLFFLLAQPEDIGELTRPLLRKPSDADKKGEKAGGSEASKEGESPALAGTVVCSPQMQSGEFRPEQAEILQASVVHAVSLE